MAKAKKATVEEASAKLAEIVKNPTIDLSPTKKAAKTATFTGTLTAFGLMTIPVKTFKATDSDTVSFNQVHECYGGGGVVADEKKNETKEAKIIQLKQGAMFCPECNLNIQKEEIIKGFKVGEKFITVTQEEIDAQKPATDKNMTLTEFVDILDIDPIYYESSEFIAPDKGGEKPFALLVASMRATNKAAKGKRVKGGREQTFVLRPYGTDGLVLSYLYADYEVRSFSQWESVPVSAEEIELGSTLIERFEAKFTPATEDKFLSNVRRMLESKAAGVAVTKPELDAAPKATIDLMAALKASLAAAPKKAAKAGK